MQNLAQLLKYHAKSECQLSSLGGNNVQVLLPVTAGPWSKVQWRGVSFACGHMYSAIRKRVFRWDSLHVRFISLIWRLWGEHSPSYGNIYLSECHPHEDVKDATFEGRPMTVTDEGHAQKVDAVLQGNRSITCTEIGQETAFSPASVFHNLTGKLERGTFVLSGFHTCSIMISWPHFTLRWCV